jgi:C-terminal processing protease CtpA/Prc
VYCSRWIHGSPAQRFELTPVQFVLAIDDVDTPDLDTVVKVVARIKDGQSVRIKMISLAERSKVYSLKVDYHYFPSSDLVRDPLSLAWKLSLIVPSPPPLLEERSNL